MRFQSVMTGLYRLKRFAMSASFAVAILILVAGNASAVQPAAGQIITNQASATYFNERLGAIESVDSNTVSVEVLPVPAIDVNGEQALVLGPVAEGNYVFRATNTGNVSLNAQFDVAELIGDDFDVAGSLFLDSNENGIVDPGEPEIEAGDITPLDLDETISLVYLFDTPATVVADDVSRSQLNTRATPSAGTTPVLTATNISTTTISEVALTLLKSAALRGDAGEIDYRISVRNNSHSNVQPYATLNGQSITVDGTQKTVVLVRDTIPLNTVFTSAQSGGAFGPVYHRVGDPEHTYLSSPPSSVDAVDAVAFLHEGAYETGRSSDSNFTVTVSASARGTEIVNQAVAYTASGAISTSTASNEVVTPIAGEGTSIEYRNDDSTSVITSTPFDRNVTIKVNAANCNATSEVDQILVTVSTRLSGDQEQLIAYETGPNTGEFRTAPIAVFRAESVTRLNNVIEANSGDTAPAAATCFGETVTTTLAVQPGGFVFDSVTNEPVRDADVKIFRASAGGEEVSSAVTDEDGYFDLGPLVDGDFRIEVVAPEVYRFPSVRTEFSGFDRGVDETISYGGAFTLTDGVVSGIDIPLDPGAALPMSLEKSADRTQVRRGGYVVYTLKARNTLNQSLLDAVIRDAFPPGFLLVDGSVRRDGEPLSIEPIVAANGIVTFDLGSIPPLSDTEITYAARVGATSGQGNRTNTAILRGTQAGTGDAYESNRARSTVRVDDRGGVFADEAVVIGRVFLDKDGDGLQKGDDEPGVPGVKIVTSTGLAVVTDSDGKYSLFGLRPLTHTFALVRGTLPVESEPQLADVDDVRAPGSRLIDLKRGELRSEDFPLKWTPTAADDVDERIARFDSLDSGLSVESDDLPLSFDSGRNLSSRTEAGVDTSTELLRGSAPLPQASLREPLVEKEFNAEEAIANLTPELGFVGIDNNAVINHGSLAVRVKSPAEALLRLEVNGKPVPDSQIGAKVIDRDRGVQLFQYVAVRLEPNENQLAIIASDPFGNERGREEITVIVPGKPARIEIVAPREAPANGLARIPVFVRILDADGRRVGIPTEITLTSEKGKWDVPDIRDSVSGLQAYLDNGEATFDFIPPDLVGGEVIGVTADFASAEVEIGFTPDLSERVLVGVVEGAVGFDEDGADLAGLMETDEISGFEETTEGVRGQLYLKGKIRGDALLTLRYDSDSDDEDRLFRDIRRDEYYPVYGDNSERGFDAQSNGPIYVKIERERSYLLYGDIAVEPQADAIRLGAYRRSLTGGRAHYEEGPVTVDLFVARTDSDQQVLELRGRGISGPYDIDLVGTIDGSEVVEILTRDRDQPSVILSIDPQQRFADYTLDFFSGSLIFNRPVPQLDDDLNPVSIRVTFETEDKRGDDYFVYGGEIRVEPVEGVSIGYREVRSDAERTSDEHRTVRSAYAETDFDKYGKAQVEFAQTENNLGETGTGQRATYTYTDGRTNVQAQAARTSSDFDAPNSSISAGREELRVNAEHTVNNRLAVASETLYTRDTESGERRVGAEMRARYSATPSLDVIGGVRGVDTKRDSGDSEVLSAIVGVAWRPEFLLGATMRAEFEQDFAEGENWRLLLGGDFQYNPDLRLYAVNEISTAETGFFGIGDGSDTNFTTKVGAEYRVSEQLSGFSEFRDSAGRSTDGGVASGVRTQWQFSERFSLRATAQHVEPVRDEDIRSTSITLGGFYEDKEAGYLVRHDIEWDSDEQGDGFYSNFAVGLELDRDFTALARNRIAFDRRGDDRFRERLRLGIAWRPEHDNRIKALGLYEFEHDDEDNNTEMAHRWSLGGTFAVTDDARANLRYAGEQYSIDGDGFEDATTLHMIRAGAEFDFAKDRFSVGGHAVLFTDDDGDSMTAGVGAEVKVNVAKNVQIGLGYSHIDIEEDRLRDLHQSGFYLRLKLKLDDSVWDEFDRAGLTGE